MAREFRNTTMQSMPIFCMEPDLPDKLDEMHAFIPTRLHFGKVKLRGDADGLRAKG